MANNIQVNVSDEDVLVIRVDEHQHITLADSGLLGAPEDTIVIRVDEHLNHVTVSDVGLRGSPGLVFRGEFTTTSDYYKGDVVTFNGSAYVTHTFVEASTVEPDQSPNFSTLVEKGEAGAAGQLGDGTIEGGNF